MDDYCSFTQDPNVICVIAHDTGALDCRGVKMKFTVALNGCQVIGCLGNGVTDGSGKTPF